MTKLTGVLVSAGLFFFTKASFALVDCTGHVTSLSLQLNAVGTVTLSLSGGPSYTYLCDVDGTRNGISPTVCRAMYATLMTAKTTGKKVLVRFYDYDTCSAVPAWTNSGGLGWTILLVD